jgi:hypothetical protein
MLRLHRVGTREVATPEVATQEVGTQGADVQEVVTPEAVVAIRQAVEAVVTRGAAGIPDTGDNAGAFAVTLNAAHEGGVCL